MTTFYWWPFNYQPLSGSSEPTQQEFIAELKKVHDHPEGRIYRAHAFQNTVYDSRDGTDNLHKLWARHD